MQHPVKWLTDIITPETLGNQATAAKTIEIIEKPSAEMCLQCRGAKLLCGKPRCPILLEAESLIKHRANTNTDTIQGSSPGGIFIGRFGYPKVYIGPLVPPYHGNTEVLDTPELWLNRRIDDIIDYRFSLIRGNFRANILDAEKGGRLIEHMQELSIADKPVDSELQLTRKPRQILALSEDTQPFGPSAPMKTFNSSNISVDRRIEQAYYDKDLKASNAVFDLYNKGVLVSRIQRAFSTGTLGIRRARKLVPTRWSITAVDSTISIALTNQIKHLQTIDEYRVYTHENLDNLYTAILMPEPWKFEWIEAWFPQTHWNTYGSTAALMGDFEDYWGRTTYANVGGCYYATRLAATEKLKQEQRQASCLLLREIHPGYLLPVGVWNVRENIRAALTKPPAKFDTLQAALNHAMKHLTIPLKQWIGASTTLKQTLYQSRITEYTK